MNSYLKIADLVPLLVTVLALQPGILSGQSYSQITDQILVLENVLGEIRVADRTDDLYLDSVKIRIHELSEAFRQIKQENAVAVEQNEATEGDNLLAMDFHQLLAELRGAVKNSQLVQLPEDTAPGKESVLTPLEITGFGDFSFASRGAGNEDNFSIGQAEIDFETAYREKVVVAAAVTNDQSAGTFGLGQLTLDFHLFGDKSDHFRKACVIDYSGIMIGQFDVPFGIDWQVYPSIDRKLVSGPLVVAGTHDFWNDYGVQLYAGNKWFNAVVFGLNGFGYDEVEMNVSAGGRLGIKPHRMLELGTSYAGFFDVEDRLDMELRGFDIQFKYRSFSLKGEYIVHRVGLAENGSTFSSSGFYGQGLYDFGRVFLCCRYDMISPSSIGEEDLTRISAGGGVVLLEGVECRLEQQFNSAGRDQTYLQTVIAF